jgi:hypothetical protein
MSGVVAMDAHTVAARYELTVIPMTETWRLQSWVCGLHEETGRQHIPLARSLMTQVSEQASILTSKSSTPTIVFLLFNSCCAGVPFHELGYVGSTVRGSG